MYSWTHLFRSAVRDAPAADEAVDGVVDLGAVAAQLQEVPPLPARRRDELAAAQAVILILVWPHCIRALYTVVH